MTMTHAPLPLHPAPLHVKVEPLSGAAWSKTVLPVRNSDEQAAPHEMPLGLLVTVPEPFPVLTTLKRFVATATTNRAITVASLLTEQGAVPEQAPVHSANTEPGAGTGFRDTVVPSSN